MGAEIWVSDPPKQRAGVPDNYHTLEDIMRECRAVTFHTPLTKKGPDATLHLCDAESLELMGENRILVNAARGPVVATAPCCAGCTPTRRCAWPLTYGKTNPT